MNHHILDLENKPESNMLIIDHEDYNLDGKDNLNKIPEEKGVYAICGRVNGKPANARWVGYAENLREAVQNHYSDNETNECLRDYMRSIKTKALIFKCMPEALSDELESEQQNWEDEFNPVCTPELNKVY